MILARLIAIARQKGVRRVVVSITIGGWDTHKTQTEQHLFRYRGLSIGLDKFTRAMKHLNLSDKITTFNVSEFGRTTIGNGQGTDHGWGTSYFVLGDSVKAGNYGTFPSLKAGGDDDETLNYALPELKNFAVKDLGFMKST